MKITMTTLGCDAGKSGIGRYAATLLEQWLGSGVDIRVLGHDSERAQFVPPGRAVEWRSVPERWSKPVPSVFWHQAVLPWVTKGEDVLFLPAGNRRLPVRKTVPTVATVHDCSSLHIEGKYDRARDFYIKRVLPWLMQKLDHVITVSESTRLDLVNYCGVAPEKISVIPLAADHAVFFPRQRAMCKERLQGRYGLSKPFLLYISRIEHPGKNHVRLIHAFESLKKQGFPHQLVFAGPDKERADEVRAAATASAFADDIRMVGPVPGEDLPHFYCAADVFVFPSLYEGFGLPLLESMACGTPVACSNLSSLPEVAGNCAQLFDPYDVDDMTNEISELLGESEEDRSGRVLRGLARAAEFNWERTAAETLKVLEAAGKR